MGDSAGFLAFLVFVIMVLASELALDLDVLFGDLAIRRLAWLPVFPYFEMMLLFVAVTTLVLFFATGAYTEKIAYANKYVALRTSEWTVCLHYSVWCVQIRRAREPKPAQLQYVPQRPRATITQHRAHRNLTSTPTPTRQITRALRRPAQPNPTGQQPTGRAHLQFTRQQHVPRGLRKTSWDFREEARGARKGCEAVVEVG